MSRSLFSSSCENISSHVDAELELVEKSVMRDCLGFVLFCFVARPAVLVSPLTRSVVEAFL